MKDYLFENNSWTKSLRRLWYVLLFSILLGPLLSAQSKLETPRFKLALPIGVNLSQIQGDPYQGFRKWGMSTGIEGLAQLDAKHQLSVSVLFQQVGSYPSPTEIKRDGENYLDMRLSYIEVPLLFHFLWKEKEGQYRFDWQLGASFARLLSSRIISTRTVPIGGGEEPYPILSLVDRQGAFKNFSFHGIIGLRYYVHPKVNLTLRHSYALNSFFEPGDLDPELRSLRNFSFSFLAAYVLE